MNWILVLAKSAKKQLNRLPETDRSRILSVIGQMGLNPLGGGVTQLHHPKLPSFRRRVGNYRILFDIYPDRRIIIITEVIRRTSTTYRRR